MKQPNREFCGKCGKRQAGGSGSGLQYRCPICTAGRLAALKTPRNQTQRSQP